jgi:hypothetical protein
VSDSKVRLSQAELPRVLEPASQSQIPKLTEMKKEEGKQHYYTVILARVYKCRQ